ncbi:E3 ubiquitin-protein ligase RNF128-like [Corythoichthys intestinalis]|uniref:E3 ubiquitin-protein ligase RNF128-like n=1 Tax=Corythoichthys intestinalis TaxID=161448 RepID=UPI0025A54D83|nr:E3 ubiquitin-protein ligase RNF128-like [Corythoichthys intestinalis]XP_061795931.1 E3 ubiquitin-protein ligase RNF128-like [Nerophis lumbriciformis]
MGKKTKHSLLLLLYFSGLVHSSVAIAFWTALVQIKYLNSLNQTVIQECECGQFGRNSPLAQAGGVVILPNKYPDGCKPDPVYNGTELPWIALAQRGNCSFSEKINAAKRQGAMAVVVFDDDGSGNRTITMKHEEALEIVAIMIGNIQGTEIAGLVKNGTEVQMFIDAGNPHGPWMDTYWLYFMSIAFFIVTAASVAYFLFISANRLYNMRMHRRAERRLKSEAKKAIGHLQTRTLKRDDKETTGDEAYMCAVCIESYKAGEVVTVLTCDHIFHKACIEPWLLEKRTCPMCKCDILKALGVEVEKKSLSQASPQEVSIITVAGGEAMYEVPLTDPLNSDPERQQNHYDNRAFEEETARRQ